MLAGLLTNSEILGEFLCLNPLLWGNCREGSRLIISNSCPLGLYMRNRREIAVCLASMASLCFGPVKQSEYVIYTTEISKNEGNMCD